MEAGGAKARGAVWPTESPGQLLEDEALKADRTPKAPQASLPWAALLAAVLVRIIARDSTGQLA